MNPDRGRRRLLCAAAALLAAAAGHAAAQAPAPEASAVAPYILGAEVLPQASAAGQAGGGAADPLHVTVWGTPAAQVRVRMAGVPALPLTEVSPGTYQAALTLGRLLPPGAAAQGPSRIVIELEFNGLVVSTLLERALPGRAASAAAAPHIRALALLPGPRLELRGSPGGQALAWVAIGATPQLVLLEEEAPGCYVADLAMAPTAHASVVVELERHGRAVSRRFDMGEVHLAALRR
jgi:hypothetical protein